MRGSHGLLHRVRVIDVKGEWKNTAIFAQRLEKVKLAASVV